MPSIASGVAVSILWIWLFNPQVGLVNYFLALLGVPRELRPLWLASQDWSMPALIVKSLWGIGANMIIILAGLQGIPVSLYEAAKIDGANIWQKFKNVTIPMLSPVLFFVIVISIINFFQILTDVLVMTQGGLGTSTLCFCLLHLLCFCLLHLSSRLPIFEDELRICSGLAPIRLDFGSNACSVVGQKTMGLL